MGAQPDNGLDRHHSRPDLLVARLAAPAWGVLSLDELRGCGLSNRTIATRVRIGHLHRLHRGVYVVGHVNLPLEGRFLAALKACGPEATLSHFSAAALWRLVEWDRRHPEVTIRGTAPREHPGIRVHRTRFLDAQDVRKHNGIRVTSPARTVLDLASRLPFRPARRAVRQALSLRLLSIVDLMEILERQGGRPGASTIRRIVASSPAPTRSVLEDVILDLVGAAGLEHPDVNVPILLDGRRVVPDLRWPARRLVVEADGAAWHEDKLAREDDAERQALLEAHGERVLRITWRQAFGQRRQTIARLRAAARSTPPGLSG